MEIKQPPLKGYITTVCNTRIDPFLNKNGFATDLVIFSIPSLGILFRCRAEGNLIDLEFLAFFSLLDFIHNNLKDIDTKAVQVISSNPDFVFSFSGNSRHMKNDSERKKMVMDYKRKFDISVCYIEPLYNQALLPSSDYPSMPQGRAINIDFNDKDFEKTGFKPFQRGARS